MSDNYRRKIDYLRISVTDRCNYRCKYCMPHDIELKPHDSMLRYEEIVEIARVAVEMGVRKIRLTGGEPLIRKGVENLVGMLRAIENLEELCLTTNGVKLTDLAPALKANGLDRVNISIDSLDPEAYRHFTGGGNLQDVLNGVDAALKNDLGPVKINMVIHPETEIAEIEEMQQFCDNKGLNLQKIQQFDLNARSHGTGHIEAHRPPKCDSCNRLRLTADGFLMPCLFSENEVKVDLENIKESIIEAVTAKPRIGTECTTRTMNQIGG